MSHLSRKDQQNMTYFIYDKPEYNIVDVQNPSSLKKQKDQIHWNFI